MGGCEGNAWVGWDWGGNIGVVDEFGVGCLSVRGIYIEGMGMTGQWGPGLGGKHRFNNPNTRLWLMSLGSGRALFGCWCGCSFAMIGADLGKGGSVAHPPANHNVG